MVAARQNGAMAEKVTHPSVTVERESLGVYLARNQAGDELRFGPNLAGGFSPVELLLAAVAGCSGIDVDAVTSRKAEPEKFVARAEADNVGGSSPSILRDLEVVFDLVFPEGPEGDAARERVGPALRAAEDRTCTVSRTISNGASVTFRVAAQS